MKCVRERSIAVGPGLRASYFADRTLVELAVVPEGGTAAPAEDETQVFVAVEVQGDYLVCVKESDDPATGTRYSVAKPQPLSATYQSFVPLAWADNDTYTITFVDTGLYKWNRRRLTSGTTGKYWDEFLDPLYGPSARSGETFEGSRITARKLKVPAFGAGTLGHDGQPIYWEDINVEARHYRPVPMLVALCVDDGTGNAVTKYAYIAGGPLQS